MASTSPKSSPPTSLRNQVITAELARAVVSSTSRPNSSRARIRFARGSALVAGGLAAGFGLSLVLHGFTAAPASTFAGERIVESPDYSAFQGSFVGDYIIFGSTTELAERSSLVFRGTVTGTSALPPYTGMSHPGVVTVLELNKIGVAKGDPPISDDGVVRLVLPPSGREDGMPGTDANVLFPVGTEVVAYASLAWITEETPFPTEDASIPGAEPVAASSGPFSVAVQTPGSAVVAWPMLNEYKVGPISEALPGGILIADG